MQPIADDTPRLKALEQALEESLRGEVYLDSFGYHHYDLSRQVGEDRLFPAIRQAVAEDKTVIACGVSCRHQLHDMLQVRAKHWVEVARPGEPTRTGNEVAN